MLTFSLRRAALMTLGLVATGTLADSRAAPSVRVVAYTGQQAPGAAPGVTFRGFGAASINGRGEVVFRADVVGPGVSASNSIGLWRDEPGRVMLLARAGQQAAGLPQGERYWFDLNAAQFAFLGPDGESVLVSKTSSDGIGPTGSAAWVARGGALTPIARSGDPAPFIPGASFDPEFVGYPMMLDRGLGLQFSARLIDASSPWSSTGALYRVHEGETSLIVGIGGVVPGMSGQRFTSFHTWQSFPDNPGRVLLPVSIGPPGEFFGDRAFLAGPVEQLLALASPVAGQAAPGGPSGVTYLTFYDARPITGNRLAILAKVEGGPITQENHKRVYVGPPDALELALEDGDEAPGMPAGSVFTSVSPHFLSDGGAYVFAETRTPGSPDVHSYSLWRLGADRSLAPMIFSGQAAPSVPGAPDARFGRPSDGLFTPVLLFNGSPEFAFSTQLHGPSITPALNSESFWFARTPFDHEILIRAGDTLTLPNGQTKAILSLTSDDAPFTSARAWNGRRQLVLRARFLDHTHAVLVVSVPQDSATCAADANADGGVDFRDLVLVLSAFGAQPRPGGPGDLNLDGVVDFLDLNLVLATFGSAC